MIDAVDLVWYGKSGRKLKVDYALQVVAREADGKD